MKTMYMGEMVSAEISRNELEKLLKSTKPCDWEYALRDYAISNDMNPQFYEASESQGDAENKYNDFLSVNVYGDLAEISCTVCEEYITDDEGEYYEGANYTWGDAMDESLKRELMLML